ncbi:MAG: DUF975 family protein [Anaerovoracaceae bacterium]|jgi:uncharacterized membrane protein
MQTNYIMRERLGGIRMLGREALRGRWTESVLVVLAAMIMLQVPVLLLESFSGGAGSMNLSTFGTGMTMNTQSPDLSWLGTVYVLIFGGAISLGLAKYFIDNHRRLEPDVSTVLDGFAYFGKALLLTLYMVLFIFLWSLLFIVPGIIAAIRYSQSYFILRDNPQMPVDRIVDTSKRMMMGNKGKYFGFCLSYIGWFLLSAIPLIIVTAVLQHIGVAQTSSAMIWVDFVCSLAMLWAMAYMHAGRAAFYEILVVNNHLREPLNAPRM